MIGNNQEYRFKLKNTATVPMYEPYTRTKMSVGEEVEFVVKGEVAYNTVLKNLRQLAKLNRHVGFTFDEQAIATQVSDESQKIVITVEP